MYLIFDTETTGLPKNYNAPISDSQNWPRAVQIAWQLHNEMGQLIEHQDFLIQPDDFDIPYDSEKVHGISTELAQKQGVSIHKVFEEFNKALQKTTYIVGQNIGFDINIMGAEFYRYGVENRLAELPILDTCSEITAELCQIPGGKGGRFKLPTLTELHQFLFGAPFAEAHNATADVEATTRCFFELIRQGKGFSEKEMPKTYIEAFQKANPTTIQVIGLQHINLKKASDAIRSELQNKLDTSLFVSEEDKQRFEQATFAHLHTHTQFSVLQSTISVADLVKATAKNQMPAVAITDLGNIMGAFHFVNEVFKHNKGVKTRNEQAIEKNETPSEKEIKPIIGCQVNICQNRHQKEFKDNGYTMVFLAKNKNGYQNLVKMVSIGETEGYYYVPRIDRDVVEKYKEDIIVLSGGLQGEISGKILNQGEKQAVEALLWWKELFKDDFYLEINRHGQEDENRVNEVLVRLANEHQVKIVAANSPYYIEPNDANAHDILLCVRDGEKKDTPIGRGRGFRYGLPNEEYYFKSIQQMKDLFKDIPQAIFSVEEILNKIEVYPLNRDVLLPKFDIPTEFQVEDDPTGKKGENNYLRHLTYLGAEKKYKKTGITPAIRERLDFELMIIEKTGYPGYFLIVQDFIAAARQMGVSVGPGRGSAAGSAVAYCLGITNIDPIEYDLLFERFLNPERVSMPDIDIDFEDEERGKVMQYVINKYGANQVAQIVTYGTMAAKSSIKDAGRVLDLPLAETIEITKLVPDMKLSKLFAADENTLKEKLRPEDLDKAKILMQKAQGNDLTATTIQQAKIIEGSIRTTGIHACGVIITPDDITNFVPVKLGKGSDLWVTQFDNSVVESAGLLKMDFLGLKNLTIIKEAVRLVKETTGTELNPDEFPINDIKTYELFQRGETIGIFQYESPGMQKYLKDLKPTVFADLIAMNALYRPGPLEYIPSFIARKHGKEVIEYDLPDMEEYLKETYGITVYQEQVMLLSQKLAGFTKGEADTLRKAMGKKQKDVLDKMRPKFVSQATEKGHNPEKLEKIWKDWEAFASYAFNKSHSTCYAWVAYQTAYLKANYPAQYMAALLSNNMDKIETVRFFLEECNRMGIKVLGPDVNESDYKFSVNKTGNIRFGIGAIKGVGKAAVDTIISERKNGNYKSVFDMAKRIDLRSANKKAFESIALAGGFDSFETAHRAQFFHHSEGENTIFIEKIIRYGIKAQESKNSIQFNLFGDSQEVEIPEPSFPICSEWGTMEKLRREKEVVGMYISGHPLDDFRFEMNYFCNGENYNANALEQMVGREFSFAGMVTSSEEKISKNGNLWGRFSIEDYDNIHEFSLFGEQYMKFRHFLIVNAFIFFKIKVEEGYIINKETKERSKPKIVFQEMCLLSEVLEKKGKKAIIQMEISEISQEVVQKIPQIFTRFKGENPVEFFIFNLDKNYIPQEEDPIEDTFNDLLEDTSEEIQYKKAKKEKIPIKYNIQMKSRKYGNIKICKELLEELEQLSLNFKIES